MALVLFDGVRQQTFLPISLTRALFDLKIGCKTSFEHYNSQPLKLLTNDYLQDITRVRHHSSEVNDWGYDKDDIYINSLSIINDNELKKLSKRNDPFVLKNGNKILVGRLHQKDTEHITNCVINGKDLNVRELEVDKTEIDIVPALGIFYENIWSLTSDFPRVLSSQLMEMSKVIANKDNYKIPHHAKVKGNGPPYIHANSVVDEQAVLDTTDGAIWIETGADIAQSTIYGPSFIGAGTIIKPYSIVSHSYIGKNCRVAGEVDTSIVLDYSNKSHSGYIGHSFVGDWVNFGANTATSDLKMTYGNISVSNYENNMKTDTGFIKLGSFFGDMVKTSIGTNIYGGLRLGVASHLHGFVTQDVPSFVIYGQGIGAETVEMELDSAIRTQKRMMSRRDTEMTSEHEALIRQLFSRTSGDRLGKSIGAKKFRL